MLNSVTKREFVRTSTKSNDKQPHKYRYAGCITLEPLEVSEAWGTLSEDTFGLEIADYPRILHQAFLHELLKRARHAKT